jgi:hypothetical protein
MSKALPIHGGVEGMHRDGQYKEATADVSGVKQPCLCEAGTRRRQNRSFIKPVEADQESRALLQIRYEEIEY